MKYLQADLIILMGIYPSLDHEMLREFIQTKTSRDQKIILLNTMEDSKIVDGLDLLCRYEVGAEESVLALLVKYLFAQDLDDVALQNYFDALDDGYICAECNIGEEEFATIADMVHGSKKISFIVGKDLQVHPQSENIQILLEILARSSKICVTNLLGETYVKSNRLPCALQELKSFDGTVVMRYVSSTDLDCLFGSNQFAIASKSKPNESILIHSKEGVLQKTFVLDEKLKGTIALMPVAKEAVSYRYEVVKITKREVQ
ncbi:MAG: hypothetical protein IBX44_04985 [Sulfurospirillum sp.]|nr:hypothetical protein [Sulfurospirillum sp.]